MHARVVCYMCILISETNDQETTGMKKTDLPTINQLETTQLKIKLIRKYKFRYTVNMFQGVSFHQQH